MLLQNKNGGESYEAGDQIWKGRYPVLSLLCVLGCVFGTDNCPFSNDPMEFPPLEPKYEVCKGCPYGMGKICIGWCTRKVIGQIKGDPDVL